MSSCWARLGVNEYLRICPPAYLWQKKKWQKSQCSDSNSDLAPLTLPTETLASRLTAAEGMYTTLRACVKDLWALLASEGRNRCRPIQLDTICTGQQQYRPAGRKPIRWVYL